MKNYNETILNQVLERWTNEIKIARAAGQLNEVSLPCLNIFRLNETEKEHLSAPILNQSMSLISCQNFSDCSQVNFGKT